LSYEIRYETDVMLGDSWNNQRLTVQAKWPCDAAYFTNMV